MPIFVFLLPLALCLVGFMLREDIGSLHGIEICGKEARESLLVRQLLAILAFAIPILWTYRVLEGTLLLLTTFVVVLTTDVYCECVAQSKRGVKAPNGLQYALYAGFAFLAALCCNEFLTSKLLKSSEPSELVETIGPIVSQVFIIGVPFVLASMVAVTLVYSQLSKQP